MFKWFSELGTKIENKANLSFMKVNIQENSVFSSAITGHSIFSEGECGGVVI